MLFRALGLVFWVSYASAGAPNVLILYVDNLGYGDLPCYGADNGALTPHVDRLVREGVRCTDFYVVTSSCTPSRGALLTGRYPRRNGLMHQLRPEENQGGIGLPQGERLIPQYLKEAGYATGCFGKWNLGFAEGSRPTERGFDSFLGFRSGNVHYFKHLYHGQMDLRLGTEPLDRRGEYITDVCADAAVDFIRENRDRPWFAYVPFNAVHFVSSINTEPGEEPRWQVPEAYLERYGWRGDEADPKRRFLAVLTALDDAVGRIVGTVDELGLAEKTVIAFISDNGAFMLKDRGLEVQSNAPFRDGGTTVYEGGVRVPAVFRWKGGLPQGRVCETMLSQLDLLPMCLEVAGLKEPGDRVLDGKNPLPALTGEVEASPHEVLVFDYNGHLGLRKENWKLIRPRNGKAWELYDLVEDPGEVKNLAEAEAEIRDELVALLAAWEAGISTN